MEGGYAYKKGLWNSEEDRVLMDYVKQHGVGKWNRIAKLTGLKRCGKSCRLRWMNYLSPDVKRGGFNEEEDDLIIRLHNLLGNRWSLIAGRVPGRTDNQVKNYWNTHLSKKLNKGVHNYKINKGNSIKFHTHQLPSNPNPNLNPSLSKLPAAGDNDQHQPNDVVASDNNQVSSSDCNQKLGEAEKFVETSSRSISSAQGLIRSSMHEHEHEVMIMGDDDYFLESSFWLADIDTLRFSLLPSFLSLPYHDYFPHLDWAAM